VIDAEFIVYFKISKLIKIIGSEAGTDLAGMLANGQPGFLQSLDIFSYTWYEFLCFYMRFQTCLTLEFIPWLSWLLPVLLFLLAFLNFVGTDTWNTRRLDRSCLNKIFLLDMRKINYSVLYCG
jgi:hypothetical protein